MDGPDAADLSTDYLRIMDPMPQAGDLAPGFLAEPGQCWRMVYGSANVGQGTHCTEPVVWRDRFANAGKGWDVWACERHTDELEGVRRVEPGLGAVVTRRWASGTGQTSRRGRGRRGG